LRYTILVRKEIATAFFLARSKARSKKSLAMTTILYAKWKCYKKKVLDKNSYYFKVAIKKNIVVNYPQRWRKKCLRR
jgi:hypothetical protein